jgi:hypothetical protein
MVNKSQEHEMVKRKKERDRRKRKSDLKTNSSANTFEEIISEENCSCFYKFGQCLWFYSKKCLKFLWKSLKYLFGVERTYTEFGTAFEYCYPEIRRLQRNEMVPKGYRLADFSQVDPKHGIRFAVKNMSSSSSSSRTSNGRGGKEGEEDENGKGNNASKDISLFGERGGFVEKPHYAGAVELMFNQLANFDPDSGLGDDEWEEDEGRIGPLEFFKCAEVVLRDFHSVEVLKQRDSLYSMLFGKSIGGACGSMRDRLLFDGWWKQGLRLIDLMLTFVHVSQQWFLV